MCAAAALAWPVPTAFVERYYSSWLYPVFQRIMTSASNRTDIVWFDVFVFGSMLAMAFLSIRDARTRRAGAAAFRIALRIATIAAAAYVAFLFTWGLNYQRTPLRQKLPFDDSRINASAALTLARESVARLNALHDPAHAEGWSLAPGIDPVLASVFRTSLRELGLNGSVVQGRPKTSVFDLYFRRAGVAGMTDPYFLETLVASDTLPFERPQVIAHEWAHLAGVTDEGEANFVGWLACVRARAPHQYSGWLFLYAEVIASLPQAAVRSLQSELATGPLDDLQAIRARYAREVSPRVSVAGWRLYDGYLRANRVDAGLASYGEVVQLVLGTNLR